MPIQDVTCLFEQIVSLTASLSQLQAPSPGAVITYFSLLAATGTIGYSIIQVAEN